VDEEEFAWRYITCLAFEAYQHIFDTIPQLLDWYEDFREESLDHVRDYTACEELLF
jgi:hypothetical protein